MTTHTSVLGLGRTGEAVARGLLAAGHRVTVWNRTPAKAAALVRDGAAQAATAGEAVRAGDPVVVCLSGYEVVNAVLEPVTGDLAGRTLLNLTPGSPRQAPATARWAHGRGARYLDGVALPDPTGTGPGLLVCAGPRDAFEAHEAVLAAIGRPCHVGEDPALPSVYDCALLALTWATLAGWLHGVALTGAEGPGGDVTASAYTEVAEQWLATVRACLAGYARQIDTGSHPGGAWPLHRSIEPLDILVHAGELRGVRPALPELLRDLTRNAVAAGHGDDSCASLLAFLRTGPRKSAEMPKD
ncbi:NAD(P)-binding domain-containing protein [Streptomyces sp. NPDC049585]|uniref:NAD(P)-dependent oxidoreductase n=1 Tax=Streptomyces sp. NPDC049585 TaxID=3155154 RepID=UPI00341EC3D8